MLLPWCQPSVPKPRESSLSQNAVNHPASAPPLYRNPQTFSDFSGTVVIDCELFPSSSPSLSEAACTQQLTGTFKHRQLRRDLADVEFATCTYLNLGGYSGYFGLMSVLPYWDQLDCFIFWTLGWRHRTVWRRVVFFFCCCFGFFFNFGGRGHHPLGRILSVHKTPQNGYVDLKKKRHQSLNPQSWCVMDMWDFRVNYSFKLLNTVF